MENFLNISFQIIIDFLKTFEDFHEFISLKMIQEDNSPNYKVFRIRYQTQKGDIITLRIELNFKKNKLSFAPWGISGFQTVKFESFMTNPINPFSFRSKDRRSIGESLL